MHLQHLHANDANTNVNHNINTNLQHHLQHHGCGSRPMRLPAPPEKKKINPFGNILPTGSV